MIPVDRVVVTIGDVPIINRVEDCNMAFAETESGVRPQFQQVLVIILEAGIILTVLVKCRQAGNRYFLIVADRNSRSATVAGQRIAPADSKADIGIRCS